MSFINTKNLPDDMMIYATNTNPINGLEIVYTIVQQSTLYFLMKAPARPMIFRGEEIPNDEPGYDLTQIRIPLRALPWLIDTIENKFWKKTSEGGLANNVLHINEMVASEDLLLRFSPNCRAEGVQGFTLENYSHLPDHHLLNHQSIELPYSLLREGGLLQSWKDIASKN